MDTKYLLIISTMRFSVFLSGREYPTHELSKCTRSLWLGDWASSWDMMNPIWEKRKVLMMVERNGKSSRKNTSCTRSLRWLFLWFDWNNWVIIIAALCLLTWLLNNLLFRSQWLIIESLRLEYLMRAREKGSLIKVSWVRETWLESEWTRSLPLWFNPENVIIVLNHNRWFPCL